MPRFWMIPLLCLPMLVWAQTEAPTPTPLPGDETVAPADAADPVAESPADTAEDPAEVEAGDVPAEAESAQPQAPETRVESVKRALNERLAAVKEALSPWSGDVAFGFLSTTGSSESTSYNTKLGLIYSVERYKNDFSFTAIYGEQEGIRSAERYVATNQTDYNINERDFAFLALDFEKDSFGSIEERTSQTVGYGRRLLLGPVHTLNVNAGAGSRQQLPQDGRGRDYEFIGRVSADYLWRITETSSFSQKAKIESGPENTFTEAVSELKLNIIGNMSANISFTVRDNSITTLDSSRTDTFTAVNLAYKFGS
jgi:putative salt-induced outer membrane protein